MDSHSIRKNQVFLIITTIFFQFHLPYFSLSPVRAASIDGDLMQVNVSVLPSQEEGEQSSIQDRKIPYKEVSFSGEARLLGIHITHDEPRRVTVPLSSGATAIILVTAYSSTEDQTDSSPCTTANGFDVCAHDTEDVIAANFLPFGARVQFPEYFGNREFVVQDRMHARFSNRIDIWMKSRAEAKQFGVKHLKMTVVSPHNEQVAGNF